MKIKIWFDFEIIYEKKGDTRDMKLAQIWRKSIAWDNSQVYSLSSLYTNIWHDWPIRLKYSCFFSKDAVF